MKTNRQHEWIKTEQKNFLALNFFVLTDFSTRWCLMLVQNRCSIVCFASEWKESGVLAHLGYSKYLMMFAWTTIHWIINIVVINFGSSKSYLTVCFQTAAQFGSIWFCFDQWYSKHHFVTRYTCFYSDLITLKTVTDTGVHHSIIQFVEVFVFKLCNAWKYLNNMNYIV